MPTFHYAEGAYERAKKDELHLVVLSIDGKHAKKSGASFCGPIGPKMTKKVWKLFNELLDADKRMK